MIRLRLFTEIYLTLSRLVWTSCDWNTKYYKKLSQRREKQRVTYAALVSINEVTLRRARLMVDR